VAPPDPVAAARPAVVEDRRGLRVVDDHEVPGAVERLRVRAVVAAEDLLLLLGQRDVRALERVVDRLRHVEELVLAVDHLPLGLEPRVAHERDERVEDLGDAAAEGRGREVQDALALERLGERLDLIHDAAARDRRVVGEGLVPDVDRLELQLAEIT